MKNTIPQSSFWIYLAAILLPFNGGYINAATLISFLHNSVGYVTGNIAYAGTYFASGDYLIFCNMLLLIVFFLCGAMISSFIVKTEYYQKDYRYSINLIFIILLVLISMILMYHHLYYCEYLLAMSMGMQNAMTTHYGSALIRTTHMTGTTTDLGILLAHKLKGKPVSTWKIKLYTILILSFLSGSIIGSICFSYLFAFSLLIPLGIYFIMLLVCL